MRIVFVNQCYWPDYAATSQVLSDLAEELVGRGHDVTIISSRKAYAGGSVSYAKREVRHGVVICRVGGTGWGKGAGIAGRALDSGSFFLGAVLRCLTLSRPDVVVTLTSPPMVGVLGRLTQVFRRTIHVHWCMDLFPEVALRFGVIRTGGIVHRVCAWATSRYLRTADRVLALSRHMARKIQAYGVRESRIGVVPVWADGRQLKPVDRAHNSFLQKHHLRDKFVLMYSGNLAHGGDIETMVAALGMLKQDEECVFVLISEGPRFDEFRQRCAVLGLQNVLCLPYQSRASLSVSLSAADIHIVTNRQGMEGLREPCKVYGILAAGRPFILIGDRCVATDFAREHKVGYVVEEGDAAGLVSAIRQIKASPKQWARMCRQARAVFERECDALLQIDLFERILNAVVEQKRNGTSVEWGEPATEGQIEATDDTPLPAESVISVREIGADRREACTSVSKGTERWQEQGAEGG